MKIELRVSKRSEFDNIKELPIDKISIGDEYCPNRFPGKEELLSMIEECNKRNIEWCIVTPFMSNKTIEKFFDILDCVVKKYTEINIIINDYGFMDSIMDKYHNTKFNVIMGNMLAYSYEGCPWHKKALSLENEFIRDNWVLNTFHSDSVVNYFKDNYNFKGICLNCTPEAINETKYFGEKGINVAFADKYYVISVSRNCHSARFNKVYPSKDCNSICDSFYSLVNKKFYNTGIEGGHYVDPHEESEIPTFHVAGNVTFTDYKQEYNLPQEENISISLDYRFYEDINGLKNRVNELKNGGNIA